METHISNPKSTGSAPIAIAMAATSNLSTEKQPTIPVVTKNLDYFKREVGKHTLIFWRSTKRLADVLVDARLNLSPEDFKQLLEEAQISYSWFAKMVKEGSNYRMNDPANADLLPETFSVRYEIMLLKETTFRVGVTKNIINKNCTLADVRKLREQMEGKPKGKGQAKDAGSTKGSESPVTASKTEDINASTPKAPIATANCPATDAKSEETEPAGSTASIARTAPTPKTAFVKTPASKISPLVLPKTSPEAPKTIQNRICVFLSPDAAEKHQDQIQDMQKDLGRLVAKYPFIEAVELKEAA